MNDSGIIRGSQISGSSPEGGLLLPSLPAGTLVEVCTKNHTYTVIPQATGEATVWGHPEYCPAPVTVQGLGGAYVTSVFREGYLAPGMRLSFPAEGRRVNTSRIQSLRVKKHN